MVTALICAVVQMRMSKLLRNAAENVTGLQPRSNIDFLVVGTIYRVDVLRQLLADLDGARCIVDDGFQKQPLVPLHCGAVLGLCGRLGNVEHLLGVVADTHGSVLLGVFLAGFQQYDSAFALFDEHAVILPALKIRKLGGIGFLGGDQNRIAHRVAVKTRLHIQIGLEKATVICHALCSLINHGKSALALLLLLCSPLLLVKGNEALILHILLRGGIENIIIVCHSHLSLSFFFFGTGLCSEVLLGSSLVFCAELVLCLCSSRISFISCRTDGRERSIGSEIPLTVFSR